LLAARFPCVLIDESDTGLEIDAVVSDDAPGALAAVRHLIALGHRRIAHLAGGQRTSSARARLAGYRQALREAGLPDDDALIAGFSYDSQAGRRGMEQLLGSSPTAVFAATDTLAAEAMRVIAERGLRVPKDIGVVGFCNDAFARYLDLTTVNQQPASLGSCAAKRLFERIADPALPCRTTTVPTDLVVRTSCGHVA
jgi:DNA-binding LacI/PurR family transcriptional regulator